MLEFSIPEKGGVVLLKADLVLHWLWKTGLWVTWKIASWGFLLL